MPVSVFVQRVKTSTSKWMKGNPLFPHFRGWSREYAGFSYGLHDKDIYMIVGYIMRQKEHHHNVSFAEEYRSFL